MTTAEHPNITQLTQLFIIYIYYSKELKNKVIEKFTKPFKIPSSESGGMAESGLL